MARADTKTILPLDTFAKIIGLSPLYFNQVELQDIDPTGRMAMQPATICDFPLTQHEWQQGGAGCVGREEIARAIADAEAMIRERAGFSPGIEWIKNDAVPYPRPANPRLFAGGGDIRGYWTSVKASNGYIQAGGIEAKTLISAAVAIGYTDANTDGYKETATIITALPANVTREDEVALYYPGHSGDDAWEIRPINVRITAGVATITCKREQLVIETILEAFVAQAAQGENDGDFLTTVDVYRHYNDPSIQATLLYTSGMGCYNCSGDGCVACASVSQTGCINVKNSRLGLVSIAPGDWDAASAAYNSAYFAECRAPDRLLLSYRAGWTDARLRNPYIEVDPVWARAIAYLALSLLDRPVCACENIRAQTAYWSEDLANVSTSPSGMSLTTRLSVLSLENPFGTTRGAIFAWRLVQRERLGEAVVNA